MKKILLYSLTLGLLLASGGCSEEYFELKRPPQTPWSTVEEFERAPIGLYASLFSGDSWNMAWVDVTIVKTSMGDDVDWVNNAEWGYWRKTKEFNKYTDKGFLLIYRAIAGANNALEFVEANNGNPFPTESEENIQDNVNRIVGELYFIRAYSYYLLETTFGHAYVPGGANNTEDIPMPTKYPKSVAEAKNPKIGTTQEVYDLIVADFQKAKDLLPEEYEDDMHPSYQVRASKFAASAMLMRAYFQRGEYDKAKLEADFIIDQNGGRYNLTEDPIAAFSKSAIERAKEVVFYLPYYDETGQAPMHLTVLNHSAGPWGQCGWVETRMSNSTIKRLGWMTDPITDTTLKVAAKRDKRFTQLFAVRYPVSKAKEGQATDERNEVKDITTIWPYKYYRGGKEFNTNVPLIRLAEIYLTRSISRFKAGDKSGAAEDLNVVRKRAWNTTVGGPYVEVTGADITENMIHDERLIEMFGENDRIDYLRALKMDIPKGERGAGTDPYTSEDFVWAIPTRELLYNESIGQ
ncbi:RagB/SusD family nutrient uptake outer membrane protein [Xanthocytophaga agilis]|uniref:RagB/SusD family nutrient uptake outer membrane protein n=1 Tax=Xanthocytophaga agilis TaxID=3048010 RepID=A0AAE3R3J9_9BACT|nr:RagB/SusD family nutrient uptake outer membrane protein [Xanthocytophaga agilis]MDJ1502505.1 RagB/SusD family nutrient uptake outer membrane protein [Xanthocytophaga agilis]